jgi:hypothetical protein
MDSIKEELTTPLKGPRNESELLLNQVTDENEGRNIVELLNISTKAFHAEVYHAAWGFESDDDCSDLFLFGVGGPA